MRRPMRLGLAVIAVLLALFGAYSAYWFVIAGEIKAGVVGWAQSVQADKIDASWQRMRVTGYPFAFRVEFETAVLRDGAMSPPPEVRVPMLSGTARPWDFDVWHIEARNGFSTDLAGAGERFPLKLAAQSGFG